ncbi:MAG TPA: GNAT family N-acetyltransferase [Candidatus Dormibacteraeota bacterium]
MRPGRPSDLVALREVMKRLVREGILNAVPTPSFFERRLGDFDWAARSRIVEQDGEIVGGVLVFDRPLPEGTLARAEIIAGPELLVPLADWGIALSRASAAWAVQVWRGRGHTAGLERTGLARVRGFWRMDRPNLLAIPAPPVPDGYRLLDATAAEIGEDTWLDTFESAFTEHWRHSPERLESIRRRRSAPGFNPELELMAVSAEGQPAALVISSLEEYEEDRRPQPVGLVGIVGTVPDHRRRGLAAGLTAEALRRLRAAGARSSSLYVDAQNPTRAYDVYRSLGYEVGFEDEVWELTF